MNLLKHITKESDPIGYCLILYQHILRTLYFIELKSKFTRLKVELFSAILYDICYTNFISLRKKVFNGDKKHGN